MLIPQACQQAHEMLQATTTLHIPHKKRVGRKHGVKAPGVPVLYKTKAMAFTTMPKLKTREVCTQAGYVLQRVLKQVGRATTVLSKQFT